MTLKSFTIKKLFFKYDITIKCNEKCVILLGANGVGKSTALRILYYFLTGNYVDIVAAPFSSIVLAFEDGNTDEIKFEDFLPTKEYVIRSYTELIRRKELDLSYSDIAGQVSLGEVKNIDKLTEEFRTALDEISENNKYGELVYDLYAGKEPSNVIKKILKKYTNYEEMLNSNLIVSDRHAASFFKGSPIPQMTGGEEFLRINDGRIYLFDSVENYKILNDIVYNSAYYDADLEWISTNPDVAQSHKNLIKEVFLRTYKEFKSFKDYSSAEYFRAYSSKIRNEREYVFRELRKDGAFGINRLINFMYFDISFIFEINNRAGKYVQEFFDNYKTYHLEGANWWFGRYKDELNEKEQAALLETQAFFTDDVIRDYYEYVKPVLLNHSFFDMDLVMGEEHSDYEYLDFDLGQDAESIFKKKLLMDYMKEILPLLKDKKNRSEQINSYEEVLRKYLVDKHIEIKPCGIQIKEGTAVSHTSKRLFVLYDATDIDLSVISSGERKILMIFAVAIFGEAVLFLDEPELSLSLVWQESLLPDILKYGNTKGLFLATHSPYISRAEELEQYLCFLPQRNS